MPASAQFTIRKKSDVPLRQFEFLHDSPNVSLDKEFFDRAAWNAERRRIRKERNNVEFKATLQTQLQQFENWTSSGNNTFSAISTLSFRHRYKREKLNIDYSASARYGMNVIDDAPFKNVDEWKLNFQVGWTMHNNWSYSASANLRSQFTTGYKARDDDSKVSAFMAPGYFEVAGGFTFSSKTSPFKITLSPISGNLITVLDREVSELGKYGVPQGNRMEGKIGPSVEIKCDLKFGRDVGGKKMFQYSGVLYSFTNIKTDPTVRWENTFDIFLTKYLTTTVYGQAYYLKEASTSLQYQYMFTIGLAYTFNNQ